MASVRKRTWKSGEQTKTAWIADYFDQAGKRHIKTFEKKGEATAWLRNAIVEVSKGIHTPERASLTIAEAGDLWILQAETDGLEYSTIRQYRQHLDLHIKPFLAKLKLSEITPASVNDFRNALIREKRSRIMAKKVVVSLGSILGNAMADGKAARNVVHEQSKQQRKRHQRIESRQKKILKEGVDYPTTVELRTLLTIQGRWRPFIVTAIFTGLRASELRGLTWADVDLDRGVLHVRQRADRRNAIGDPKSESGKRDIPLVPLTVNVLREWKLACPKSEANLVFPTSRGTIWSLPNLYRSLKPTQRQVGIAQPYGLHALRHAAASLFIQEGFSPKRVQTLMGHSTIQVTFDTYGHLFRTPDEQDELQRLQARLVS